MATPDLEIWQPDLASYHRLIELGAFEDLRVELLDGFITKMSPKNREHDDAIEYLTRLFVESVDRRYAVRVQSALTLGEGWEPEPDLAVVSPDTERPYHPAGATLVCEVADSSLGHDRMIKQTAYARFGIPEYWIVAIPHRHVEVHRQPVDELYAERFVVADGVLASDALSGLELPLDELWAAAFRG